jgi:Zn-dependent protease
MRWSFPLFRLFGISVRMHWFMAVLLAIRLVQGITADGWWGLEWTSVTLAILLVSILIHEWAHCFMAIHLGGGAEEILLWPLGGLSYVHHPGTPRHEIKVSGIGPISSFLLSGVAALAFVATGARWQWSYINPFESWWPHGLSLPQVFLLHAVRLNLILGLFNLCVPAYPLDGGKVLFAFLTLRHGRNRAAEIAATIAIPIGLVIAIFGFAQYQIMLGLIGLWVIAQALELRRLARIGELEAHPAFAEVSEYDYMPDPEKPRRKGFWARWRGRRAQKRAQRELEREGRERDRIDTVLEKVSREGIGSLTDAERRILDDASRRNRGE